MLLLSMGSCVSTTSVVGIATCVAVVVRLFPRRLKIASSISSATGNSIGAITLFWTSILGVGDDIVVADDTGGGGGGIVAIGAVAWIVAAVWRWEIWVVSTCSACWVSTGRQFGRHTWSPNGRTSLALATCKATRSFRSLHEH